MTKLYCREIKEKNGFYEWIYRDLFQDKYSKVFLTLNDKEKRRVARSIKGFHRHEHYCSYFTPNIFWHHQDSSKEKMLWLDAIILDIDDGKNGRGIRFSDGGEVSYHVQEMTGFIPRFVWQSKTRGNFHALILIEPMLGTPKSIYLYEKMAKAVAMRVGADTAATSCNNLIGIPKQKLWEVPGGEIYDIDDFKEWYKKNSEERTERLKTTSIHEYKVWNHPTIQKLLTGDIVGWRNRGSFTIGLLYYAMGKDHEEAYDFVLNNWMPLVNGPDWHEPFGISEVKSTIKSAFSGKYRGPSKEYIELLTGEEFPFNIVQSTYKKKAIADGGYHSGDEVRKALVAFIRQNNGIQMKQPALAKVIEKPLRSVERTLKKLKSEGVITMETERGRYSKGTTFKLRESELEGRRTEITYTTKFDANTLDDFLENA